MTRTLGTAVAAISYLLSATGSAAWAQAPSVDDRYGYGPHMMWWGGGFGMILGPLFMIVALALAIALALALVRWFGGGPTAPPPGKAPLDILKERYARGDIDKNEFEERRRALSE